MKHKLIIDNGNSRFESTLLIPNGLKNFFDEKVTEFGGLNKLFCFMVNNRHPFYNQRPMTISGRTTYSPTGLKLERMNFIPRNEDWERFRIIAQSMRISMCLLFVILLIHWDMFETNVAGVPATPIKLSLLTTQITYLTFTIIQLCRHRI